MTLSLLFELFVVLGNVLGEELKRLFVGSHILEEHYLVLAFFNAPLVGIHFDLFGPCLAVLLVCQQLVQVRIYDDLAPYIVEGRHKVFVLVSHVEGYAVVKQEGVRDFVLGQALQVVD